MKNKKKLTINILTPTFNEQDNVSDLVHAVSSVMSKIKSVDYFHTFIDNASTDNTVPILKKLSLSNKHVRIIVNNKNYGQVRSPYYGLLQSKEDATILISADFEEPPSLIPYLIDEWKNGNDVVCGVVSNSNENFVLKFLRIIYYKLLNYISEDNIIKNFSGYALYSKKAVSILRSNIEPYPYLRGLITRYGFSYKEIRYDKKSRKKGVSKNRNFISLADVALLGLINHSNLPIRALLFFGLLGSFLVIVAFIYKVTKDLYFGIDLMNNISIYLLLLILLILFGMFFIQAIVAEYVLNKISSSNNLNVIERERINF